MKVCALLLGYFFDKKPFYVYRIIDSDLLLFKLADISLLFSVPHLPQHHMLATNVLSSSPHCYRDSKDLYLSTKLLGDTAVSLNKYLLAEFCKLKPNDYSAGLADSILNAISRFERVDKIGEWVSMDLSITCSADGASTSASRTSNTDDNHNDPPAAPKSPNLRPIKAEPLSPPSFVPASPSGGNVNQKQANSRTDENETTTTTTTATTNPMALDKVLSDVNGSRHRSGSASEHPNKKQRLEEPSNNSKKDSNGGAPRARVRNVLPKPVHTVSSQTQVSSSNGSTTPSTTSSGPTINGTRAPSSLLSKRLLSKQGKNARNLTIFAPSYNGQLGIRSAPLNSNFFQNHGGTGHPHHPQQQQAHATHHQHSLHPSSRQQQGGSYGYPPQATAQNGPRTSLLHPGHHHQQSLAPLLSPLTARAAAGRDHSPHKQEFAIPPIVPSQQQPPMTAHPSSYHHYAASPMYNPPQQQRGIHHGYTNGTNSTTTNSREAPPPAMPPQTPTTTNAAAAAANSSSLQRQQFLQPFEQLFETIETTRTLKSTLDEQIRRSSTLMQTLQASSTTIEGLVRNQIKEAQKELMVELDGALESILGRIEKLEQSAGKDNEPASSGEQQEPKVRSNEQQQPPPPPAQQVNGNGVHTLQSPPTIVRSQNDIGPHEYHDLLDALRERLERLERQFDH
ncbi:hypothetical protein K492DRAFT_210644 [Lichtheimia hyalospora FSU 10163]|nr:hypothetical protein K492DRAFT_210644 [Lichtheimia hyalospora FSU 10163]